MEERCLAVASRLHRSIQVHVLLRFGLALAATLVLLADPALARAGGGERWGGGRAPSQGGGDSSGAIGFLIQLLFASPVIGIVVIVGIVVVMYAMRSQGGGGAASFAPPPPEAMEQAGPEAVAALKQVDPKFSPSLFNDFAQLLYTRFHVERGSQNLDALAPYFAPDVLAGVAADAQARHIVGVDEVLVGSSRISALGGTEPGAAQLWVDVTFESNFTEHLPNGPAPTLYVTERWQFARKRGVVSKGPEDMTRLNCPSCGSPSELRPDGTCPYCDRIVNQGDFQWVVRDTRIISQAPRPGVNLLGGGLWGPAQEVGLEIPTLVPDDFIPRRQAFDQRNPDFAWPAFEQRAGEIFVHIQQAWASGDWLKARPFETDHLFNTHRYWIEMYKKQGLVNRLDDIQIGRIEAVKFDLDAFYDTITVRIFASMKDYLVNRSGQVVGGNPQQARAFSEYWTFMRRTGTKPRGTPGDTSNCPNCGAPLKVTMAGECEYCNGKVTSGNFDWVLSQIEQDEAYRG